MKNRSIFISSLLVLLTACPELNLGEPGDRIETAGLGLTSGTEMAVLEEEVGGELAEGGTDTADPPAKRHCSNPTAARPLVARGLKTSDARSERICALGGRCTAPATTCEEKLLSIE